MSNTSTQIDALLNRLREGDPDAAKELFTVAFERFRRRAHQMLRPGDPVYEEQSPTALLCDSYEGIVRAVSATKPPTYEDLLRLVNKKLRESIWDVGRSLIHKRRMVGGDAEWEASAHDTSPSRMAARREFLEAMKRLVAELDSRQRCMLYYLEILKLTQKETAQRLEMDESTVKRSYRELKPLLLKLMAKHLVGEGGFESLSEEEKRAAFDASKDAALDALWSDSQIELESLPPEEVELIDVRWCCGLPDAEAAENLKMDVQVFRAKWDQLVKRLSPMVRDLLKQ
jgi:RNA polymerase sigma factor (sigma-70 family)